MRVRSHRVFRKKFNAIVRSSWTERRAAGSRGNDQYTNIARPFKFAAGTAPQNRLS
jgi:hypothetical protein